ncbi:MAG TPA: Holliday junction resolvase RuvX [Acidobacteriota bacterium]|nr:Holliday junction resolvase RuvX [Acidobacteriota bacterium]
MQKRILALDVGKKRIGIAVSDPLRMTARPHSTIERNKAAAERIAGIAAELETGEIVIGLPLHLDGREGEQAADVRKFAAKLETVLINTPILFWDERLSTVEAQETMTSTKGKHAKTGIDAVAAAHILQSYLRDTQQNHGG